MFYKVAFWVFMIIFGSMFLWCAFVYLLACAMGMPDCIL